MSTGYERVRGALDRLNAEGTPRRSHLLRSYVGTGQQRWDESIIAKDEHGRFHLLVVLPDGAERFTLDTSEVLSCQWETLEGRQWLDVTCTSSRLLPTFTSLVGEMLDRAEASDKPAIDELRQVLDSWRRALARAQAEASREVQSGFFGELLVALQITQQSPAAVERVWKGPDRELHDFAERHAVEVKTYRTAGAPIVTIHGVDQLDPPPGGELHLIAYRVREDPSGTTVQDLADELERSGVSGAFVNRAFDAVGLPRRSDDGLHLVASDPRIHLVGADFPGLRRSRLESDHLHGVDRVQYGLVLDACPGRLADDVLDTVLEQLIGVQS